jgi:hypothetical protein
MISESPEKVQSLTIWKFLDISCELSSGFLRSGGGPTTPPVGDRSNVLALVIQYFLGMST